MKRGIDEKNMGPMFPRLHVNDTEKGGPRAPPRNKMALYEQLSIPSQRFNGGVLPLNHNSTSNYTPLPPSSSQGCVSERGSFLPHQQTPTKHASDRYPDLNNQQDEDFTVPVFVQQFGNQSGNYQNKNALNNSIGLQSNGNSRDHIVDSEVDLNVGVTRVLKETFRDVGPARAIQQEMVRSRDDLINADDVSENSMVDSMSGADISPDDVVGIIGQKHFWKARRAIVNQQRVFSVQVFELHRLIKVQRLIAGLPQSIVEEDSFLGKVSQIKKIPLESVLKSSINVPKIKDNNHEKPNDETREFSAENASLSSVQNDTRSTFTGYPLPPSDPKMGSWSLGQQSGHQWLIPFMSPSEGLIYKPYPGPGYMTPGPGPPPGNNFKNHGVPPPTQPHYQWPSGFQPLVYPPAHGYFPSYGMPTMNPSGDEQLNHPNPFNMHHQTPVNVPNLAKFHASNNNVQVSTASSTSQRTETSRDALPLFPTHPLAEGGGEPTRAIRVVPRNARLATESVARIFQSIQEERKQ